MLNSRGSLGNERQQREHLAQHLEQFKAQSELLECKQELEKEKQERNHLAARGCDNVGVPVARRFMSKAFGRQRLCRAEQVAKARAAALQVGGRDISDETQRASTCSGAHRHACRVASGYEAHIW